MTQTCSWQVSWDSPTQWKHSRRCVSSCKKCWTVVGGMTSYFWCNALIVQQSKSRIQEDIWPFMRKWNTHISLLSRPILQIPKQLERRKGRKKNACIREQNSICQVSSRCHDNRSKRIIPHILTDDVTQPSACALSVGFSEERKKNKQPPRSVTHSVKHLSRETSHTLHTLDPRGRSSCAIPPCAIILALSASWKLSFRPAAAVDVVLIRIGPLSPIELLTSVLSFSGLNGLLIGVIAPWAEPHWSPALLMNHWSNERMWGRGRASTRRRESLYIRDQVWIPAFAQSTLLRLLANNRKLRLSGSICTSLKQDTFTEELKLQSSVYFSCPVGKLFFSCF